MYHGGGREKKKREIKWAFHKIKHPLGCALSIFFWKCPCKWVKIRLGNVLSNYSETTSACLWYVVVFWVLSFWTDMLTKPSSSLIFIFDLLERTLFCLFLLLLLLLFPEQNTKLGLKNFPSQFPSSFLVTPFPSPISCPMVFDAHRSQSWQERHQESISPFFFNQWKF